MRLALIADIHMRNADHEAVTRVLDRAVDRIEGFAPDRTVVLGDLVEDADPAADRRNFDRVRAVLDPLAPRYMAGNHDTEHFTASEVAERLGTELGGHETVAGTDLVYLDTAAAHLPAARSAVPEEQLELLGTVLAATDEALVFAHHPIHYRDLSDNAWFGEHPELAFCSNKAWIQRRFDEFGGVLATFNGHVHEFHHARYRAVDHFTINAVNKEHPDSEAPTGSHALVTLDDDRLRVEAFDRDGFRTAWEVPRRTN